MYPRVNTIKKGDRTYHYLQILESFRKDGRAHQRVVANLGRLDLLGDNLDRLVAALSKHCKETFITANHLECKQSLTWGPVLLARYLWRRMELSDIIHKHCQSARLQFDVAETSFVLVANRLCEPASEHGLARWLEHTFVCDSRGRRWQPDWLPAKQITRRQRVKVEHRQLNRWYRTLDVLLAAKENIEEALYQRVRDLFSVKVDLVFYDLTSSYFCRKQPKQTLRRHGQSKDKRPRQVQVVLGVVMANGFPIAHHVFPGNTADKSTLKKVLTDLQERFGLGHIMVVSDRGLVSEENLQFLSEDKYILKTDDRQITAADAVACYKELSTVERGFRDLKDVIEMRPMYHKTDERIEAHIFVASLALFLKRVLEHQLVSKLPEISATEAFAAMKSVGVVDLDFHGQRKRLVSAGGRDARRLVAALGIRDIAPADLGMSSQQRL